MKVKAIKAFRCKNTGSFVGKGQVLEINDERANELLAKGAVEKITKSNKPKDEPENKEE